MYGLCHHFSFWCSGFLFRFTSAQFWCSLMQPRGYQSSHQHGVDINGTQTLFNLFAAEDRNETKMGGWKTVLKIVIRVVAVFLIDIFNKKIEYRFVQFKSVLVMEKKKKTKKMSVACHSLKNKKDIWRVPINQIDHFQHSDKITSQHVGVHDKWVKGPIN